ncbi:CpsB/CapC family capsule biosynthesis tyrosine phosphatase [Alkalibacillus aidingensis]|uniref:CpsB/CapC family capsule biosynthesis tyrosine phosphatase n=1 Tax=Alkalibacillus aidingensis TaxID=2747607 RepID=UPI00374E1C73
MIDLHSHISPGADDGANTLDDSLEMALVAVADGSATKEEAIRNFLGRTRRKVVRRVFLIIPTCWLWQFLIGLFIFDEVEDVVA